MTSTRFLFHERAGGSTQTSNKSKMASSVGSSQTGSYLPTDEERSPLLDNIADVENAVQHDGPRDGSRGSQVPPRVTNRLYISHFLSTWNSRVFEFGAALYLASIFPGTLLPMSVYALTRGASAIVFSPAIGQYIDTGNRLQVVRLSIGNRKPLFSYCFTLIGA